MLTLSLFRNLSNMRLYLIGSISVICRQYATIEPAAEPLPGPTVIPFSRAYLIKSHTIRKYSTNPMLFITSSSLLSLENKISAFGPETVSSPYLVFSPCSQRDFKNSNLFPLKSFGKSNSGR